MSDNDSENDPEEETESETEEEENVLSLVCDDALEVIFEFLTDEDLFQAGVISRRFRKISERNRLWKHRLANLPENVRGQKDKPSRQIFGEVKFLPRLKKIELIESSIFQQNMYHYCSMARFIMLAVVTFGILFGVITDAILLIIYSSISSSIGQYVILGLGVALNLLLSTCMLLLLLTIFISDDVLFDKILDSTEKIEHQSTRLLKPPEMNARLNVLKLQEACIPKMLHRVSPCMFCTILTLLFYPTLFTTVLALPFIGYWSSVLPGLYLFLLVMAGIGYSGYYLLFRVQWYDGEGTSFGATFSILLDDEDKREPGDLSAYCKGVVVWVFGVVVGLAGLWLVITCWMQVDGNADLGGGEWLSIFVVPVWIVVVTIVVFFFVVLGGWFFLYAFFGLGERIDDFFFDLSMREPCDSIPLFRSSFCMVFWKTCLGCEGIDMYSTLWVIIGILILLLPLSFGFFAMPYAVAVGAGEVTVLGMVILSVVPLILYPLVVILVLLCFVGRYAMEMVFGGECADDCDDIMSAFNTHRTRKLSTI